MVALKRNSLTNLFHHDLYELQAGLHKHDDRERHQSRSAAHLESPRRDFTSWEWVKRDRMFYILIHVPHHCYICDHNTCSMCRTISKMVKRFLVATNISTVSALDAVSLTLSVVRTVQRLNTCILAWLRWHKSSHQIKYFFFFFSFWLL